MGRKAKEKPEQARTGANTDTPSQQARTGANTDTPSQQPAPSYAAAAAVRSERKRGEANNPLTSTQKASPYLLSHTSASLLTAMDRVIPMDRRSIARAAQAINLENRNPREVNIPLINDNSFKIIAKQFGPSPLTLVDLLGDHYLNSSNTEIECPQRGSVGGSVPLVEGVNLFDTTSVLRSINEKNKRVRAWIFPPQKMNGEKPAYWEDYAAQSIRLLLTKDSPITEIFLCQEIHPMTTPQTFFFFNSHLAWSSLRPCTHAIHIHEDVIMDEYGIDGVRIKREGGGGNLAIWHLKAPELILGGYGEPSVTSHNTPPQVDPILQDLVHNTLNHDPYSVLCWARDPWTVTTEALQVDPSAQVTPLTNLKAGRGELKLISFSSMDKLEDFFSYKSSFKSWRRMEKGGGTPKNFRGGWKSKTDG